MINLKSKTLCNYYSDNPDEYYIKFIHHNIIITDESTIEYQKLNEDLKNIYKFDPIAFIIYFSDINNYIKLKNNINIDIYKEKIYLRIRNKNEYQKLIKYNKINNLKIIVDLNDLEKLDIKNLDLVIQIDCVKDLSVNKLQKLLTKYTIKEILVGQISYIEKSYEYLYDIMAKMYNIDASKKQELEKINKITNDIYSVKNYIKIHNKFDKIIKNLNIKNNVDGFYKIFNYIAKSVTYDNIDVTITKIENQNLIGAVLNGISVCEGYSKYLQQMLSLINVDCIIVQGGSSKENGGHVWNQVLIDDIWYNADVTAASYNYHHNKSIKTCLVKDSVLLYQTNSSIAYVCNEDYKND